MTNLKEYIKSLSLNDKKTLSQKALKTCEEVGELAKAVLPFDSAPGTNHRFIDRDKILEEIADVYLTNISIAYSLNFTDEEIDDMIQKKAVKWQEIQSKESKSEFPLPFEIHITVDMSRIVDEEGDPVNGKKMFVDDFKRHCESLGVKPIVLELQLENGTLDDIMTSSKHFGDNRSAYEESERIANYLSKLGYRILRKKIETVPWHPAVPVISKGKEIPNGCYFESHIGVVIHPSQKNDLNDFVESTLKNRHLIELGGTAKLSQNFFKKSNDGKFINMLTYRNNMCGSIKFKLEVEAIKHVLIEEGFEFEKVEVEYAIYDTNVGHDSAWLKNN